MADPVGSLLFHPDQEDQHKGGGASSEGAMSPESPLSSSSLSSSSSPPSFYSPPQSPPALLLDGDKAGMESDLLSPWLGLPGQLRIAQTVSDDGRDDAFGDLDWMAEKVDLNDLDLDSLIGSCSPTEESPDSPEDLLASLDCPMELDFPLPALSALPSASPSPPTVCTELSVVPTVEPESHIYRQEVPSPSPCVPEPQQELEIKSEPESPDPSPPLIDSSSSPAYTLDLGSEVYVSGSEVEVLAREVKPVVATVVPQVPRLVFSLSPTRIVLVLAPKDQVGITTATVTTTSTTSEVTEPSAPSSSLPRSSRSRPYPEPRCKASPPSPGITVKVKSLPGIGGEERTPMKAQKTKKIKKMEQNKTAATRYRQKKRAEQDNLTTEHAILERKNMELTEKVESMAREIEYLKELMEEVRLTRMKKGLSGDP